MKATELVHPVGPNGPLPISFGWRKMHRPDQKDLTGGEEIFYLGRQFCRQVCAWLSQAFKHVDPSVIGQTRLQDSF